MKLPAIEAANRLASASHGVMSTLHPTRGIDLVPVVYGWVDNFVGIPIDKIKQKQPGPLQRELNLARDPRATLLIEKWDADDWSKLWWARAEMTFVQQPDTARVGSLTDRLAEAFSQYQDRPFERLLVFQVIATSGWAA